MSALNIKKTIEEKMIKSIESLKNDLQKVRTGRAHTGILDHVQIDYYGSMLPITQVANVSLADARTITIQPWEKNMVSPIEKAIRESDLGLNPATMGETIRVPMPALTEERRKELTKFIKGEGEHCKVSIRNLRRDANDSLKRMVKDKEISEDEERRSQDEVQKLTDKFVAEVDSILQVKEAEIMTV